MWVLNRNDNVKISHGFGSVVAERIVDLMTLLLLVFLSIVIEYKRVTSFLFDAYAGLNLPGYVVYLAPIFLLLGIGILIFSQKRKIPLMESCLN